MVARLTPDQKVACSNHVGVNPKFCEFKQDKKITVLVYRIDNEALINVKQMPLDFFLKIYKNIFFIRHPVDLHN